MGIDTMELNMTQELATIYQEPFLLVFTDLRKEYGTLDHGCLLQTLEGYGEGPKMCGVLAEFY